MEGFVLISGGEDSLLEEVKGEVRSQGTRIKWVKAAGKRDESHAERGLGVSEEGKACGTGWSEADEAAGAGRAESDRVWGVLLRTLVLIL